jgi:serine protease AprX
LEKAFKIAAILCLFSLTGLEAQNKKYVVFFNRKVEGNPYSLNNPTAFLSPRSVQRRQNQGLALDSTDLPVIPSFLAQVSATGAGVLYPIRWLNGAVLDCTEPQFQAVMALPFVEGGKPLNTRMPDSPVRKKPVSGIQMLDYGQSLNQNMQLELDSMHNWGYHGEGKLIAVMDAGFQNINNHTAFSHLFQGQKIKGVRDLIARDGDVYSDHWHGGAVLSNIAGYLPGSLIGGAYAADYFLIRSEDAGSENEIECAYWVVGLELADSIGADVVNSSLGYTTFDTPALDYSYSSLDGNTSIASRAASRAASKGMIVVNSAGNEGNNSSWGGWISVPADARDILAAGAINGSGNIVSFSGKGPTPDGRIKPDLVAMGSGAVTADVFSTSGITFNNGTSFSAPILSGLVAGFWQAHPGLSALQVINLLKNSGSNRENPDSQQGWGIPGFIRAHLLAGSKPRLSFPFEVRIFPNPSSGHDVTISLLPGQETPPLNYQMVDSKGKVVLNGVLDFSKGKTSMEIPVRDLKAGVYHLRLTGNGGTVSKKILLD